MNCNHPGAALINIECIWDPWKYLSTELSGSGHWYQIYWVYTLYYWLITLVNSEIESNLFVVLS